MTIKYFSQGSIDESDGLTVSQAMFDQDGNFLYGEHSRVTVDAIESGSKVSVAQYAAGAYKGKSITKDEFDAHTLARKDSSKRGHVGIVSETGKAIYDSDVTNHNEFIEVERIKGLQPLADEVHEMANLLGKTSDSDIETMYKLRGLKNTNMIAKVNEHRNNPAKRKANLDRGDKAKLTLKNNGHNIEPRVDTQS